MTELSNGYTSILMPMGGDSLNIEMFRMNIRIEGSVEP